MMTESQLQALAGAIRSSADAEVVAALAIRNDSRLMELYNAPSGRTVWKTSVHKNEVGKAFVASALAAITAGNNDKLANFAAWNETIDPQRADQRAFFDDIFSVAAGATTRAALNALWRRTTTRAENIFAVGTGTEASPAVLGWEGTVALNDISDALNRY